MADSSVENKIESEMEKYENAKARGELTFDVLKAQKEKTEFDNRFLVYIFGERLALNHYNCDSDIFLEAIDYDLDLINDKAREHLKECHISNEASDS